MQIIVSGQHLHMTDALKAYAEKKIGKLDHYFHEAMETGKVEMVHHNTKSPDKNCEAKVQVRMHGAILSAREEHADMYAAIDLLFEKLEKQLKKYKDKMKARKSEKLVSMLDMFESEIDFAAEEKSQPVVYTVKHPMKPMAIEEAALQLKSSKQEFIAFTNDKTNQMNVIYRRKDGDFGLIEPEY